MEYLRNSEKNGVDLDAGCLYRYVHGAGDVFFPHCHEYYELFLTVSGTVTHWVNDSTCELPEGSLVFIRPDDVHGYIYDTLQSRETAYVNITFTRETIDFLFRYLSDSFPSQQLLTCPLPPTVVLTQSEKEQLLRRLGELDVIRWPNKGELKVRMRVILADIFTRFFYHIPEKDAEPMPEWLSHLLDEMEHPENFTVGVECMVTLCGKSREHLARSIKKHLGVTVSEYINDLRINYAANMLISTNRSILDICFLCGFQNVSHFYRLFAAKYKMSPKIFRQHHSLCV